MNNDLAVAMAEVRDSWDQLEDALGRWFDPSAEVSFKASRWFAAREQLRDVLLDRVAA